MAKANFRCSKCDRSFSMAAHLARHTNAMHGPARKKAVTKKRRKRKARKAKRTGALGRPKGVAVRLGLRNMSLEQLREVIEASRTEARRKLAELEAAFG